MAPLCGFPGIQWVGIDYALLSSKASLTDPMENRHEIRNPDAQQFLRRLRSDLRIYAGRHVGMSRDLCFEGTWMFQQVANDTCEATEGALKAIGLAVEANR